METFFALLAICAGNSPVPSEFPAQRPVIRGFDVFFDLHLNKQLGKRSWGWWFETLLCPLWRHCNDKKREIYMIAFMSLSCIDSKMAVEFCPQERQNMPILQSQNPAKGRWEIPEIMATLRIYVSFTVIHQYFERIHNKNPRGFCCWQKLITGAPFTGMLNRY